MFVFWLNPFPWQWVFYTATRETLPLWKLDLDTEGAKLPPLLQRGVKLTLLRGDQHFPEIWFCRFKFFPKVFLIEPQQCARYKKAQLRGPSSHVLPLQCLGSEWVPTRYQGRDIGRSLAASPQNDSIQKLAFAGADVEAGGAMPGQGWHSQPPLQHQYQHQHVSAGEAGGARPCQG